MPSESVPTGFALTEGLIRRRAYEIYLSRSPDAGDAVSDWLQAERELREKLQIQTAP